MKKYTFEFKINRFKYTQNKINLNYYKLNFLFAHTWPEGMVCG